MMICEHILDDDIKEIRIIVAELLLPDRPGSLPHQRPGKSIAGPNSLEDDQKDNEAKIINRTTWKTKKKKKQRETP